MIFDLLFEFHQLRFVLDAFESDFKPSDKKASVTIKTSEHNLFAKIGSISLNDSINDQRNNSKALFSQILIATGSNNSLPALLDIFAEVLSIDFDLSKRKHTLR